MATDTFLQITQGAGTKLHTFTRVVGVDTVHESVFVLGISPFPTYSVTASNISTATAAAHTCQVMAGASLNVYITRIKIAQRTLATTSTVQFFEVRRLTTAGTGGTAITPAPFDLTDAAAGAAGMTLPTVKGTESTLLRTMTVGLTQTAPVLNTSVDEWLLNSYTKPIRIASGTANGIVVKNVTAIAAGTVDITFEFFELSY
jgi:hypothetical protein